MLEEKMKEQADVGLIGLAVMGQNLVLNLDDHGYRVAVYNRTVEKVERFLANEAQGRQVVGAQSLPDFINALERPRRIILMLKAGEPVDSMIEQLLPPLDQGDIIVDGGNSHFLDSTRRARSLGQKGFRFVGTGISGGEEGARYGPSIMPGGHPAAWPFIKPVLQAIAAKAPDGTPCCAWVGEDGAGHFVKMVHNGIEYGDMQLICETYDLLRRVLNLSQDEICQVFADWNRGLLKSHLIEITIDIMAYKVEAGSPLLPRILDVAGQKGTGKWTVAAALDTAVPLTLISEAVFARFVSALKDERLIAATCFDDPAPVSVADKDGLLNSLHQALYASKLVSYAQGFMLMRAASEEQGWNISYGDIALMWRNGCIIRASFLDDIKAAFARDANLINLLLDPYFKAQIQDAVAGWRQTVSTAVLAGIPTPAMSSALAFYDSYRQERLPANLLQAQRDYFGAHTYERVDRPRGEFFHTNWTGRGGNTTSTSYNG
jgi:6-phosphogluconate dehydrogenase